MSNVRVRIAPSPTGYLHIGNLRTAIFNLLFARHHGGAMLVRIEDTDRERSRDEYTQQMIRDLAWAGITFDEPIVIQSERLPEHTAALEQLLAAGKAYRCYCPAAPEASATFNPYDRSCRDLVDVRGNSPYVIRIKLPTDRTSVTFQDMVLGTITIGLDQLDDFIIARSDGTPVYNFVVVVDDAAMKISHIIRGADHVSNTPKQILLYEALGFTPPHFAHLPLIIGASGAPLSKRDAAVAVRDYKANGYLPQALCNYLVRLGWSHKDQEIFTQDELIKFFDLDAVGKSSATFDQQKLDWMNGVYMRETADSDLYARIKQDVAPEIDTVLSGWSEATIVKAIGLYKDRAATLKILLDKVRLLHNGPEKLVLPDQELFADPKTALYLADVIQQLAVCDSWDAEHIKQAIQGVCTVHGIKLPAIAKPIRFGLLGLMDSPGVFDMLALLDKSIALDRLTSLQRFVEGAA